MRELSRHPPSRASPLRPGRAIGGVQAATGQEPGLFDVLLVLNVGRSVAQHGEQAVPCRRRWDPWLCRSILQ